MPQNIFACIKLLNKQQKWNEHLEDSSLPLVNKLPEALAAEENISDLAKSILNPASSMKSP